MSWARLHVATLMKQMGIMALYRRPTTSHPTPGHQIYPYLLRKVAVTKPNQVWAMDITSCTHGRCGIIVYLVAVVDWYQPQGARVERLLDYAGDGADAWRHSTVEAARSSTW